LEAGVERGISSSKSGPRLKDGKSLLVSSSGFEYE
jgi:hypothetical protein